MMIAAPRSPAASLNGVQAAPVLEASPKVETLLGVGELLNPDIQIEFVGSIGQAHLFAQPLERNEIPTNFFAPLYNFIDQASAQSAQYTGVVSPMALTALGVTQQSLKSFVRKKHGYDIYFCNLDIESESLYVNQWQQVIAVKPAFEAYATSFLDAAGLDANLLNRAVPSSVLASYALLIGTRKFWCELQVFLQQSFQSAFSSNQREFLQAGLSHHGEELSRCLLIEFIRRSVHLRSFKFKSTLLERRLDGFLLELRTMKDLACNSKSSWLLGCWFSYQALYRSNQSSANQKLSFDAQVASKFQFF